MSILALALASTLAGPPTDPDFEAGKEAFAAERYADAARHFERAHRANPDPLLLFVWAQAERLAGQCEAAVPLYRRYLALDPPDADVQVTRAAIEACGEDPDVVPEPPPAPSEESDTGPESESESTLDPEQEGTGDDPPPSRPALRDPWGHGLTWPGVLITGVGVGLLSEAHRRRKRSERAPDEQDYRDSLEGAPALSRAGIGLMVGGGALLVAGVVRFVVVAGRGRRTPGTAVIAPHLGGAGLVWKFELAPRRVRALR